MIRVKEGPVFLVTLEEPIEGNNVECLHLTAQRTNDQSPHSGVSVHMYYIPYDVLMQYPEVDAEELRVKLLLWEANPEEVKLLTSNL